MNIYKRYSDTTKCLYFMIKDEKKIDKFITILEKVSNIIKKKIIVNLYIIKIILKLKKDATQKKAFNVFIYQ